MPDQRIRRGAILALLAALLIAACGNSAGHPPTTPLPPTPTATLTPEERVGRPIKSQDSPAVYRVMENGEIRHIVDWATFLAWDYAPGDIVEIPSDELAAYPMGKPLTRWLMGENDPEIYFLLRRQRYLLADDDILRRTGGTPEDVSVVPDGVLARFPVSTEPLLFPSFDPTANYTPAPEPFALAFPDPREDYTAWLQTWPRPERDNGRCLHYLQYPAGDVYEILEQIARLEQIGARWVLINYTSQDQLGQMAPLFQRAGIMVVWRPYARPYETYPHWADDARFLIGLGVPPYIQVYNEPSLEAEWDGRPMDQALYVENAAQAVRAVYDAGGYPGLQTINPDWTRAVLRRLNRDDMRDVLDRLFYVPHMYGANHPPDYDTDIYSVIGGFQAQARVFEEEIGFVPPMIAGEGGWRPGEASDVQYPPISAEMHRDYHVAVFEWFRVGTLSNGDPLPDYLFAFCPWLISDPADPAAWWDSASGDRALTIEAVAALPPFERRFSWD